MSSTTIYLGSGNLSRRHPSSWRFSKIPGSPMSYRTLISWSSNQFSYVKRSNSTVLSKVWKPSYYASHKHNALGDEGLFSEELDKLDNVDLDGQTVKKVPPKGLYQAIGEAFQSFHVQPWTVPWTVETVIQVMLLWIASFWFVGSWTIPFITHAVGISKEALGYRGQALYSLITDFAEGLVGVAILHGCLSRYRPLPPNWFRLSLKGKWQLDVFLGCLMFPVVNRLSQFNIDLLPITAPFTTSSVEQSIMARDPVAMSIYIVAVSVCAPVWEEIIFRGFLLPSLTRYMPVWSAVVASAFVFALAHFNIQRMFPLVFLGLVMGTVFARSRNLLASIIVHSLWNGFVFLDLMK